MKLKRKEGARRIIVLPVLLILTFCIWRLGDLVDFLSLTKRVDAKVLVVEGWIFDYMLDDAVKEIERGGYKKVVISGLKDAVGNSSLGDEVDAPQNKTTRHKKRFVEKGIDESIIHVALGQRTEIHRTYYSAVAVGKWLESNDIDSVNVFTGGTHARKTYVVYKRVLGSGVKTGIISSSTKRYSMNSWRMFRRRGRIIFYHFIGYLYALCWPFWVFGI